MKKTTRRFLALFLALTLVLGMGVQTFASGTVADTGVQTQTVEARDGQNQEQTDPGVQPWEMGNTAR